MQDNVLEIVPSTTLNLLHVKVSEVCYDNI